MNVNLYVTYTLLIVVTTMTKCTAKSKLSLWIDENQVFTIAGYPMQLNIIYQGSVIHYLSDDDFGNSLPSVPSEVDTVNLTWEAGDELFTYWFDNLKSKNKTILYHPLLSIPASGIIPKGPKIFQMSIPCTGNDEGVATLVLGLHIMDQHGKPIRGSPIKLRLKKQCHAFETTNLCKNECQHGGRCNRLGECECTQGYHGQFCELDMCNPSCENKGTCISPNMCLCLDGFYGKRCEKALCLQPCHNGGRCVQPAVLQPGICWCTSGFYGEACEFSYCQLPCRHEGLCVGPDKCHCKAGYSGDRCEKVLDRRRRRDNDKKEKGKKKRKKTCKAKETYIAKRCTKRKKCKSKQDRISNKCSTQPVKRQKRCVRRQEKLFQKCVKNREKRRKRCQEKREQYAKRCRKDVDGTASDRKVIKTFGDIR